MIAGNESGAIKQLGKRARSRGELEREATAYVRSRMYGKGGVLEASRGFWHKTGPAIFGSRDSINVRSMLILSSWVLLLLGSAVVPVLGKRALQGAQLPAGAVDSLRYIAGTLQPSDYMIAAAGLLLVGLPKMLTAILRRKERSKPHLPYPHLAAAIKRSSLVGTEDVGPALTDLLHALRIEMSDMAGDGGRGGLTEATLLQYCDPCGTKMFVTARTKVGEDTHRPKDSFLFLANYIAREGRWFAEHDFLSKRNPFKPVRLTVAGSPRVDYRSVLYLPITTAVEMGGESGTPSVRDFCIGVICVHSKKPFRFWRWGDHNNDNGGGSGNVAFERAVPYIALACKLIGPTAFRVPVEAGNL